MKRFARENLERNQRLGTTIVPLIGARTRAQLAESLGALRVTLTPADIARIEDTIPATAVAVTRLRETFADAASMP
jgi:aryl-alcohol dehydrogenase-like predicted oxidoreductase